MDITEDTICAPSDNFIVKNLKDDANNNTDIDTKDCEGVTALIAKIELTPESESPRANKQPLRCHPSNNINILLDSGSNGDLYRRKQDIFTCYLLLCTISDVLLLSAKLYSSPMGHLWQHVRLKKKMSAIDRPPTFYSKVCLQYQTNANSANVMPQGQH